MPLNDTARACERTRIFRKTGGRQSNDFGLDVLWLGVIGLTKVLPKLGRLGFERIDHHHVLQIRKCFAKLILVWQSSQRIKALTDETINLALGHSFKVCEDVVLTITLRQIVITEIVFLGRIVPVIGLHQASVPFREVLRKVHRARAERLRCTDFQILLTRIIRLHWREHIARQNLRVGTHIGDALHVGMATQCINTTARPAHVTQ